MRKLSHVLLFYLLTIQLPIVAKPLVLADNRRTDYCIVTNSKTSEIEKFACEELKKYLDQITDANYTFSNKLLKKSIVVCNQNNIHELNSKADIPVLSDESFGIFQRKEAIYLVGGTERSVLYAVYEFLENLGCRWIAPDFDFYEGTHQFIPSKTLLKVDFSVDKKEYTTSKYRKFYITGQSRTYEELMSLIDWMPKLRVNHAAFKIDGPLQWSLWRNKLTHELQKRGIVIEVGGHGYNYFLSPEEDNGKLFENHPEWFGVNKRFGIKELGYRSKEKRVIFCTSNKEAIEYLHKKIANFLHQNPEIEVFDFWPPDQELWCECSDCLKMGSISDRHSILVNQTAEFLKKSFPKLKLECLAYHHYFEPPLNFKMTDKVLVDFADYYQNFEYQFYDNESIANKIHNAALVRWTKEFGGDISIYSYYRKGFWRSLPNIMPHYIQNDLKYYNHIGIKGVSVYSEPKDWFTYGLNHYVLWKLAWNPEMDVNDIISEYCMTVYGNSAPVAEYVYREFEDIVRFACVIHQTTFKTDKQYDQYTARIQKCIEIISNEEMKYEDNTTTKNHLFRLELMAKYAEKSVEMMRALAAENRTKETSVHTTDTGTSFDRIDGVLTKKPPLDKELIDWLKKYANLGVFALEN